MINIAGLDKAKVLAALYNGSRQQGLGFLDPVGRYQFSVDDADVILRQRGEDLYFDYLHGRVMKVNLRGDEFEEWLYDRDNGAGAAKRVIDALRAEG
jgi:hypothetical protein